MTQPITANTGPRVVRGLRSAIGSAIDLAGPGAGRWTNSPYDDPFPNADRWAANATYVLVSRDPGDTSAYSRATVDDSIVLCGTADRSPDEEPWEYVIDNDGEPFVVIEIEGPSVVCSTLTMGGVTDSELSQDLLRRHDMTFWPRLERTIWRSNVNQNFSTTDWVDIMAQYDTPTDPGLAFAALESALIERYPDGRGLIWVPAGSSTVLADHGVEINDRGITREGNQVVFLTGVDFDGSDGPVSTSTGFNEGCLQFWMFATSRLQLRLGTPYLVPGGGDVSNGAGVDYSTNDVEVGVRQAVAWGWHGKALGVFAGVCSCGCCPAPVE